MSSEKQYLDILTTLSSFKNKLLLGNTFKSKLFRKALILREFTKEQIEVSRVFWSLLPTFMRPKQFKQEDDLDLEIIFKSLLGKYPKEPLRLFGYHLYYLPEEDMTNNLEYLQFSTCVGLIEGIITLDQYCLKEFIKDNSVIFDVGANIGVFSLYASYLSPNGKIYAFEPTRNTFQRFKKNIINNNLQKRIFAYPLAVGDKKRNSEIMVNNMGLGGENTIIDSEFLKGRGKLFEKRELVKMIPIDEFMEQNKIKRVDFIKIDTEGYEKQVINGARKTIQKFAPIIACSVYHLRDDKIKIPELVKSINYNYKFKIFKRAEEDLIFWQ